MKKGTLRLIWNALLAVTVFVVWTLSFFFWRKGALSPNGWSDLKFFTVESNLLVGIVSVIWLVLRFVKGEGAIPKWVTYLKYLSTVMVFVTFTVVLLFLGPLHGYADMYYGSNLFFHLLIPLFAIGEYVLTEEGEIGFRESFLAMIPPVLYGIGYLTNCLVNGIGTWETSMNDWYSFLTWGYGVGAVIFIVIGAIAFGLGVALRAMNVAAGKIKWEE